MPTNRKDQLRVEARIAINQAIRPHVGILVRNKIGSEIRKAFPFGPAATVEEIEIWNEEIQKAKALLEKWPQPIKEGLSGD